MAIRLFNTMSGKKEELEHQAQTPLGMYVCGVTVYDKSHIGHARCYVAFDLIYRYLRYRGFNVNYVRNFTDVDDKIIKRSNELGVTARELTEGNIALFHRDMGRLGCLAPAMEPRVSDHMPDIVDTIQHIIANGHGYHVDGTVYFDIDSWPTYGKLSGRKLDDMQAGASARVDDDPNKRNPMDFVLWKPAKPGEPSWDSPWGKGRPGWHIECSAMSMKYLGAGFQIHGGGKDLVFPHHENELAQSEAASGTQPFVRWWMHNGFVNVDQEKMSKSLGNFFTIEEVLKKYHEEALRLFLLGTHYRSPLNFSSQNLDEASARLEYFYETLAAVRGAIAAGGPEEGAMLFPEVLDQFLPRVDAAMEDDFNSAAALGQLSDLMRAANEAVKMKKKTPGRLAALRKVELLLAEVAKIFGVLGSAPEAALLRVRDLDCARLGVDPAQVEVVIAQRTAARAEKNFAESDRLRDSLLATNVMLMDGPDGTRWKIQKAAPAEKEKEA
jgi:cysteinyl-tRNA synthetase